jgi:hypothetical protein
VTEGNRLILDLTWDEEAAIRRFLTTYGSKGYMSMDNPHAYPNMTAATDALEAALARADALNTDNAHKETHA